MLKKLGVDPGGFSYNQNNRQGQEVFFGKQTAVIKKAGEVIVEKFVKKFNPVDAWVVNNPFADSAIKRTLGKDGFREVGKSLDGKRTYYLGRSNLETFVEAVSTLAQETFGKLTRSSGQADTKNAAIEFNKVFAELRQGAREKIKYEWLA
ncbi:MAG: hypothetical protein A2Y25_05260 [Candidatus Melainabacteria bacterium GWF2_37_15]|nr:MAG: hypothetical protein A2Y25_05260 [Candidatus Melainabacteria bacterium GWF2_37_15]